MYRQKYWVHSVLLRNEKSIFLKFLTLYICRRLSLCSKCIVDTVNCYCMSIASGTWVFYHYIAVNAWFLLLKPLNLRSTYHNIVVFNLLQWLSAGVLCHGCELWLGVPRIHWKYKIKSIHIVQSNHSYLLQ